VHGKVLKNVDAADKGKGTALEGEVEDISGVKLEVACLFCLLRQVDTKYLKVW
jgi:hypothetical protein